MESTALSQAMLNKQTSATGRHDLERIIGNANTEASIKALLIDAGKGYNTTISATANLFIAMIKGESFKNVSLITFDHVTLHYDANDRDAIMKALHVEEAPELIIPSYINFKYCTFDSSAQLKIMLTNDHDIITLEGDAVCMAEGECTVHLSGKDTKATVDRKATVNVNIAGATGNGGNVGGGTINLNVPGAIGHQLVGTKHDISEKADDCIINAYDYDSSNELYDQDYSTSYTTLHFTSYADNLINWNRVGELFQLAKSKIENLSSDDELNRGWFYLAKAAQHGHTDSINLITTLINTAKSSIANDAFKTDHSTKNLIHLRVAADAGYEPAAHYLAENFEQAMRAPLPLNDQDFNTVMPFIDSASDAGYVPAIAYYNNHVNNG